MSFDWKYLNNMSNSTWNNQAKYDVTRIMSDAMLNCFEYKIGSSKALYISPQEIADALPARLNINRYKHITKHHSGQWEIRNKHIHCFFGFQVTRTLYSDTKSTLKNLIRQNSEQYRYNNYIPDNTQNIPDCYICEEQAIIDPHFDTHICRVRGHFKCYDYRCNGNKFTVGICLLDPRTERPPTRYKCANCCYPAKFIRYDLKKKNMNTQQNDYDEQKSHRKDLCEACHIWGDCRLIFIQPSVVYESLSHHRIKCGWSWNKNCDGIIGSFTIPTYEYDEYHEFEIRPYVNCVRINSKIFYTKGNFSSGVQYSSDRYSNNNHRRTSKKGKKDRRKNNSNKNRKKAANTAKQNSKKSVKNKKRIK